MGRQGVLQSKLHVKSKVHAVDEKHMFLLNVIAVA